MYDKIDFSVYISVILVVFSLKFGLYDLIREILYNKRDICLKYRKKIMFSKMAYHYFGEKIDELLLRKIVIFVWIIYFVVGNQTILKAYWELG